MKVEIVVRNFTFQIVTIFFSCYSDTAVWFDWCSDKKEMFIAISHNAHTHTRARALVYSRNSSERHVEPCRKSGHSLVELTSKSFPFTVLSIRRTPFLMALIMGNMNTNEGKSRVCYKPQGRRKGGRGLSSFSKGSFTQVLWRSLLMRPLGWLSGNAFAWWAKGQGLIPGGVRWFMTTPLFGFWLRQGQGSLRPPMLAVVWIPRTSVGSLRLVTNRG